MNALLQPRFELDPQVLRVLVVISVWIGLFLTVQPLFGLLLLGGIGTATILVLANRRPFILIGLLWLVAPFNYGRTVGPATIKLTEAAIGLMLLLIFFRLLMLDPLIWIRLRRAGAPIAALILLGVWAVVTAAPRPNFFNVRYEIQNYIALIYAVLFFERRHWRPLIAISLAMLSLEGITALVLRFGFGLSGVSFFAEKGITEAFGSTAEDIDVFSGGRFRLAGTFGHKNILAAFFVLLLPLVGVDLARRFKLGRLAWLLPAVVALALTDSMTGWGAIALIVALVLIHLRRFDYLAMLLLLIMPFVGLALYRFGESIFFRVEQLLSTHEGWTTVSSRGEIFNISMRLIAERPLFGIGRNNFMTYGQTYYAHAHNLYLMKMIEMGVFGGIAFCLFIVAVMVGSYKRIAFDAVRLAAEGQYYRTLAVWLGCLGFCAMNFFDFSYSNFALGPIFMTLLGVLLAVDYHLDEAAYLNATAGEERDRLLFAPMP